MFENGTRNQHFISQGELILNRIDPAIAKTPFRIYEFSVVDREVPTIALRSKAGTAIEKSLSCLDLYSFDVGSAHRRSLEALFHEYERDIRHLSTSLLSKLETMSSRKQDLTREVVDLVAAKILNFLRNPYSVTKSLNTFGAASHLSPTDPDLAAEYARVQNGSRQHEAAVCQKFGLTREDYNRWLRALFVLLAKDPREPLDPFGNTIKRLFESQYTWIQVFHYPNGGDSDVCVVSDRGVNHRRSDDDALVLEFNISSRAFVQVAFIAPGTLPDPTAQAGNVHVTYSSDDLEALAAYNQLTAYQCASRVFAASLTPRFRI